MIKIDLVNINDIRPYENNAKIHTEDQIRDIALSIEEFGFNDPIAVDENNIIIEGHGRLEALKKLGWTAIPIIKLSHLTEDQKRAYIIAHNKLTLDTGFDLDRLTLELDSISEDMLDFTFFTDEEIETLTENLTDTVVKSTPKGDIGKHTPTGIKPELHELVDDTKYKQILENINKSNIPNDVKEFLRVAAARHYVFNYSNIVEYYIHSSKEIQELFEESSLVIKDSE